MSRLCRWFLGGFFVYAGGVKALGLQIRTEWVRVPPIHKTTTQPDSDPAWRLTASLHGPALFRDEIRNYRLGRFWWIVHPAAILMPWIEIVTGLSLILGFWVFESTVLICGMLLFFNAMVGWAMHRGLDINCGCTGGDTKVGWLKINENFGLLAIGLLGLAARWRVRAIDRKRKAQEEQPSPDERTEA